LQAYFSSSIVEVYWFRIPCFIFLLRLVSFEKKSTAISRATIMK
jgi:hypothetical protein